MNRLNSEPTRIYKTEVLKLIGTYHWLAGHQKKAKNYWNESIKEAKRKGSSTELARTYMEIGKRFLKPNSKYRMLNGITAEDYLEKAKVMFEKMDLQWDLDELEKVQAAMH